MKPFLDAHSCEWHHRENLIDAIPFPMRTYHSHTHTYTHTHTHTHTHLGAHSCEWHHRENLIDAIPFPMRTYHSHTHTRTHTHKKERNKCKQKTCSKSFTESTLLSNQIKCSQHVRDSHNTSLDYLSLPNVFYQSLECISYS